MTRDNLPKIKNFSFQHIGNKCLHDLLNSLTVKKATGHDDISAKMRNLSAPITHILLVHIFNKSIDSNVCPSHIN